MEFVFAIATNTRLGGDVSNSCAISAHGFADYFLICSGNNPRQIKAISDSIQEALGERGIRPAHVEGYDHAGWILLDYFDFLVHIFSPDARAFYALERLWGNAKRIEVPDPAPPEPRKPSNPSQYD